MADKNIQEGDEVSWKWGTSEPTGTVAEVKTGGKLEIETKGKLIHKNADPSNPAVHVERTGNDVVKRASELTKLNSSAEGGSAETSAFGEEDEALTAKEHGADTGEKETEKPGPAEKVAPKKEAPRKKSNAAATTGEKRTADDADGDIKGALEEANGKKTKKAKTTKAKTTKAKTTKADAGGEKKALGRPRKDSKKAQDEQKHSEGEAMNVDANAQPGEGEDLATSKTSDYLPTGHALVDGGVPAANTRSKD